MHFLSKVVPKVEVGPGHVSAYFIEKWRLHQLFDSDVFEVSKRDFRYIAFLELVAEDNKYLPLLSKKTFPKPYPGFQDDLEYYLHSIFS